MNTLAIDRSVSFVVVTSNPNRKREFLMDLLNDERFKWLRVCVYENVCFIERVLFVAVILCWVVTARCRCVGMLRYILG